MKTKQKITKEQRINLVKEINKKLKIEIDLYDNGWNEIWFKGYLKNKRNYNKPTKQIKKILNKYNIKGLKK